MMGVGGGFGLWTDQILGTKNVDLAVIYTFIINVALILKKKWELPKWGFIKAYKWFIIFMGANILFSSIYYQFSYYQILQGGRSFLLIFSLPILIKIRKNEFDKLLQMLINVCALTSFLYILQITTRTAIMPYGEFSIDSSTGLPRFYNFPANLDIFLALTFLKPELFGKILNLYRVLFFTALICTLGRTYIFSSIMLIFLVLLLNGKFKKMISTFIVIGLFTLPFSNVIEERFTGGGTSDMEDILSGKYREYNSGQDGGTMVYRFAWIYERFDYMIHRPLGEQLFGLGLISDSQPWVNRHYKFKLGIRDKNTGEIAQLATPDISYGNMLVKLGFIGSFIYLWFAIAINIWLYKYRKCNPFILLAFASMTMLFLHSFAGSSLSETRTFAIYFFFLSLLFNKKLDPLYNEHNHRKNSFYPQKPLC